MSILGRDAMKNGRISASMARMVKELEIKEPNLGLRLSCLGPHNVIAYWHYWNDTMIFFFALNIV